MPASNRLSILLAALAPVVISTATCTSPCTASAQSIFVDSTKYRLPAIGTESGMDVEAVDIDKDGDLDIILANEFQPNTLLLNDGHGYFTNASIGRLPQVVRDSEDIAVADFDRDGDLDIVFVSEDDETHEYYVNDGTTHFTDASSRLPKSKANAVVASDLTGDGFPDLVIGNDGQDLFLVNDGTGSFIDETATRLPQETNVTQDVELADIDADGDLDMVVGNEDGNTMLINTGRGVFSDRTKEWAEFPPMETRKVTFADVDNDGDPDFYLSNVDFLQKNHPQDRLYLNDGEGHFMDYTAACLPIDNLFTLDAKFIDADLDGDLDLITGNFPNGPVKALRNDGTGVFTEATSAILPATITGSVLGIEIADLDGDGRQDIYVCNRGQKDVLLLRRVNSSTTGVEERPEPSGKHSGIERGRAQPNPFIGRTTILYALAAPASVRITIYDCMGERVETIERGFEGPGEHALTWNAPSRGAGAFFCRIDAGSWSRSLTLHALGMETP